MKKLIFSFLALLMIFSCNEKEKKEKIEVIKTEKSIVIIKEKQEEKVEEKIEKVEKIEEKIEKEKIEEVKIEEKKEEVKKVDNKEGIFRPRYIHMIKIKNPSLDLSNINMKKYVIEGENIIFGDNKELSLNINDYKMIFKAHNGLPSIYTGEKLNPIKREIDKSKKHIVFSFDDGPTDKYHILIRNYFNSLNETATFCVTGKNAKKYSNILKETYLSGHEIINHSYNHPNFVKLNNIDVLKELIYTNNVIYSITGEESRLFRPPYGSFDDRIIKLLGGKKNLALWNVDSEDWKNRNTEIIINRVLNNVKDGDIVLFHDLVKETYDAITYMMPILQKRGYQFVSYSDMMEIRKERRMKNVK